MANWKYLAGLLLIVSIVWFTLILCLAVVYSLLPSLERLTIDALLIAVIQLLIAGVIILFWLYSWNMLVRIYFRRSMNKSIPAPMEHKAKKRRTKEKNPGHRYKA